MKTEHIDSWDPKGWKKALKELVGVEALAGAGGCGTGGVGWRLVTSMGPHSPGIVCLHSWMNSTSLACKMISHRSQTYTFSDSHEGEMEERRGDNGGEGLLFPNQ